MWYAVAGVAMILVMGVDAFITVFTSHGGGWITNAWTRNLWRGLLKIHRRRPIHRALSLSGPALLLSIVVIWYLGLVVGWALIFLSSDSSVINTDRMLVTDWHQKLSFVGVTLSTLGYGNQVPNGVPWTFFGNLTALSGTILLTSSLSYVIAVLTAAIERRQLATSIFNVGETVESFVRRAWAGESGGALDSHLVTIAADIDQHAHKHVNFPILRFFHDSDPTRSPGRAVLLFSDAVFMVSHAVKPKCRPPLPLLHVCECSIANYLEQATAGRASEGLAGFDPEQSDSSSQPAHLSICLMDKLGLSPVDEATLSERWKEYQPRREQL